MNMFTIAESRGTFFEHVASVVTVVRVSYPWVQVSTKSDQKSQPVQLSPPSRS